MPSNIPPAVLPSDSVKVGGSVVEIRSLTRAQAYSLKALSDEDAQEASVIAWGTGWSLDEAQAWREQNGFAVVTPLVDGILRLSGLKAAEGDKDDEAPKG